MPRTEVRDLKPGSVKNTDVDIVTAGEALITKVLPGDGLEYVSSSGVDPGTGEVTIRLIPIGDQTIPFISGLVCFTPSVIAVTIGIGQCADSTEVRNINVTTPLTVTITTSGAGGLDTGTEAADTWYAVFVIDDTTNTNAPIGLFSLSPTAPTLPAGYDVFRRVGWVRNNTASNFYRFNQEGSGSTRPIRYQESLPDLIVLSGGGAQAYTNVILSEFVPPTSENAQVYAATTSKDFFFRPDGSTLDPFMIVKEGGALIFEIDCPGQIIEYKGQSPAGDLDINVLGYADDLAA